MDMVKAMNLLTQNDGSEFISGMSSTKFLRHVQWCLSVHVLNGNVRAVVTQQLGHFQPAVEDCLVECCPARTFSVYVEPVFQQHSENIMHKVTVRALLTWDIKWK